MKKILNKLTITAAFAAVLIFTACQTPEEKADSAKEKVDAAQSDLTEAENDVKTTEERAANVEEWKTFKAESELTIRANDVVIAQLKLKMKKPGNTYDEGYAKKIEDLEKENKGLQTRINAYDKGESGWESFKREFNSDMEKIGKALKELSVNNEK